MSREKIIDAAAQVFSKYGYHKTKMDDIATAAGVAKGTLYYHFPSKAQLFSTLVVESQEMVMNEIRKAINTRMPIYEQIKLVIEININLYLEYKELAKILLNEMSSGIDNEILQKIQTIKESYIVFIADLLRDCEKEGLINKINFELAAAGIIGMLDGMCKYYLKYPEKFDSAQAVDSMLAIITSGILKEKGARMQ